MSGAPAPAPAPRAAEARPLPRLGFLGVGWIGRSRMESLAATGLAEVAAVADVDARLRDAAAQVAPGAAGVASLDELLALAQTGIERLREAQQAALGASVA